jgi:hypothetical protein
MLGSTMGVDYCMSKVKIVHHGFLIPKNAGTLLSQKVSVFMPFSFVFLSAALSPPHFKQPDAPPVIAHQPVCWITGCDDGAAGTGTEDWNANYLVTPLHDLLD